MSRRVAHSWMPWKGTVLMVERFEQDRGSLLSQKKEALRKLNRGEVIFNDAEDGSEDVHLHEQV